MARAARTRFSRLSSRVSIIFQTITESWTTTRIIEKCGTCYHRDFENLGKSYELHQICQDARPWICALCSPPSPSRDRPPRMSGGNSTPNLPNPYTPLAFYTPEEAYLTTISIYVVIASIAVLIWDILDNVSNDFHFLFYQKIKTNTVVYFVSRLSSLGYLVGSGIFQTAPVGNCEAWETFPDIFYPISLSSSALLFFFRLRAVYRGYRVVIAAFFVLWLSLLALTALIPITARGTRIGNTAYCVDAYIPKLAYAALIAPMVNDTLVFIAISWKLAQNTHSYLNLRESFKVVILGHNLPTYSRAMLHDGQKYFVVTLIANTLAVVLVFNTSIPTPLRSMCSTPNVALTNIMACRVYRNTRAGLPSIFDDDSVYAPGGTEIVFADMGMGQDDDDIDDAGASSQGCDHTMPDSEENNDLAIEMSAGPSVGRGG